MSRLLARTSGKAAALFIRRFNSLSDKVTNLRLRLALFHDFIYGTATSIWGTAVWTRAVGNSVIAGSTVRAAGDGFAQAKTYIASPDYGALHALIIGIDGYESKKIQPLRGGVYDADAMDKYLREDLRVPAHQILNLRDRSATRSAIIRELKALARNPSIKPNDPVLIFFAGHGVSAKAPPSWESGSGIISMLAPYDCFGTESNGKTILPIPDRTIGALLHEIAEGRGLTGTGKGNNITVILDCCFSGSGTRSIERSSVHLERGFRLDSSLSVPPSLDDEIWRGPHTSRAIDPMTGFTMSGLSSHVLLAACRELEQAHEIDGRGLFTSALIHALRLGEINKLTYKGLMRRVLRDSSLKDQIPQCEGRYINRVLFNNADSASGPWAIYPVSRTHLGFTIDAGSVHGITRNDRFLVYATSGCSPDDTPLAIMAVTTVGAVSTVLSLGSELAQDIPIPCFALHSFRKARSLRLHLACWAEPGSILHTLRTQLAQSELPIVFRENEEEADLTIRVRDGHIEYTMEDPVTISHRLSKPCMTTAADFRQVQHVLQAAARFFWHFTRSPESRLIARHGLRVRIYELCEDLDAGLDNNLRVQLKPHGEDLNHLGVVSIEADNKTAYGVAVESDIGVPLHVWACYFDCGDLSIKHYYQPPACGDRGEPALPAKGRLTIGFGDGGGSPWTYFVAPGRDTDVGYLKVFVSTQPIDLSDMAQCSPFRIDGSMERGGRELVHPPKEGWEVVTVAIIHRKPGTDPPSLYT
ncbi:unnamed protein product [Peniophora sp. CBMAI 1063]|nr:unnamed protein product [Peniophora sp. CBMAI 1063]